MITLCTKKTSVLFFIIAFICVSASAQEDLRMLINPAVNIKVKNDTPWSYKFGVANREVIYRNNQFDPAVRFLEFSHFTSREVGLYGKLSAGVRYRFIEMFPEGFHNELRFIEEYTHSKKVGVYKISHRFRLAQRFKSITVYRGRYRVAVEFPLNGLRTDNRELSMEINTETVWEMANNFRPTLGQRFTTAFDYNFSEAVKVNFGLEYRYRNYTGRFPYTQLFFLSGLSITL
ncbi:DUF2490 domain-containing protein [Mesonia aquimarina]|uniref:DUF2490 domain-containing protein n=1 Tax=Mesonia aquimarina TaxID=1504967 RepID=UPI000EF5A34B|nr:DUF2490 domain-containing protein [Mesonia aquimarina]